jgi:hypothetical protein
VGQVLGAHNINICQMHVGSSPSEGIQMMVLNLDKSLPDGARSDLEGLGLLRAIHAVELPPATQEEAG